MCQNGKSVGMEFEIRLGGASGLCENIFIDK
jgi:hypothetical protein